MTMTIGLKINMKAPNTAQRDKKHTVGTKELYKTTEEEKTVKQREAFFDNARFFLILLVVFGHLISPLKGDSDLLNGIYTFIYLFHMPAFILISGYFSKGYDQPGYIQKVFRKTLIPYFIFQIIYCFFYYLTGYEDNLTLKLFDPHWTLWFLLSLFFWNLMLKVFAKRRYALPLAFLLGIAVGYLPLDASYLSVERTFTFFPIFLLGTLMDKRHFEKLSRKSFRIPAVCFLFLTLIACFYAFPDEASDWLLGSKTYADMGVSDWSAGFYRALTYAVSIATTLGFLAVVPKGRHNFTVYGARTLYIYLLHGFIIKLIGLSKVYNQMDALYQYSTLFIGALLLCRILGSGVVKEVAKPMIELKAPKFLHKISLNHH